MEAPANKDEQQKRMISKRRYTALILSLTFFMAAFAQKLQVGSYTFKDGSIYTGELVSGKPNGKGRTVFKNGDIYEGDM